MHMLKNIPLLDGLSDDDLKLVGEMTIEKQYPKNAVVITEGELGDSLFAIMAGRVKVFIGDEEGREVILKMLGPGDVFGEMSLLTGEPRSASVEALTDCRLLSIDKADLEAILRERPRIVAELAAIVARRRDRTARALGAARGDQEATLDHTRLLMARIRSFFGLGEG